MLRRCGVLVASALVLVGVLAGPASAHVTIKPGEAEQGSYSTQVFQVPNETSDADTTQVEVTLPTDHPIASVSVESVSGWEIKVEKGKPATSISNHGEEISEVVTKITWSGGSIPPGYFQTFPVSMGPLPETGTLTFKAVQTYSNGDVVRWIEEAKPGSEEPERPAPVLALAAASGDADDTTATTVVTPKAVATSSDVDSAKTIGIVAAVLGALGLIVAIVALVKNSRQTS